MAVSFGAGGSMTAEYTGGVPAIGSVYPVVAASALPASGTVGQIVSITDFGVPYVQMQWNGGAWEQITHFYTTWAGLPSATTFLGFVGYITNFLGGFRVIARAAAGGNYWRPLNQIKLVSYQTGDPVTSLGPNDPVVEYVLTPNVALPGPGFILVGDLIVLDSFVVRSGTLGTSSPVTSFRMGTSSTETSNPAVITQAISGSTTPTSRSQHKAILTAVDKAITMPTTGVGITTTSNAIATKTITDITTANQFASLTIISTGVAEIMTPYATEVTFFPNV